MKKLLLLVALICPLGLAAQNAQQAEEAFQKNDFAKALKIYRQLLPSASAGGLYTAQLRIIASQYMLGEYQHAAESAFTFPLPENPIWKARFLLYRIQTADRVKNTYAPILNKADEEDAPLSRLSREQWNDKINESFETLWTLRKDLLQAPIAKETLILEVKDTDQKAIPTLFDFVVLKWKERLFSGPAVMPIAARRVLNLAYTPSDETKDNAQKGIDILAEAARLGGKNRADARIIWQAQLLMLPFQESRYFTFADKKTEREEAIRLLNILSGYTAQSKGWLDKITKALRTAEADYGKAYAALLAAQMLNESGQYKEATQVCDWAGAHLTKSFYTQACAQLAADIRQPVLNLKNVSFSQNPDAVQVPFSAHNIPTVYARIYKVTESDLRNWQVADRSGIINSWRYLTQVPSRQISNLLARRHVTQIQQTITYPKQHGVKNDFFRIPPLTKPGFYAVAFSYDRSFDPEQAPVQAIVINNTDLALFVSAAIEGNPADYDSRVAKTFQPNVFRLYTLNLKTGMPESNTKITYFTDQRGNLSTGQTDEDGRLSIARPIRTNTYNHYSITPKADKNGNTAFMTGALYFYYNSPAPYRLFVETDRAIYRPGQKVQLTVYGFEQAGRGLKTMPENSPITLTIRDANYEKIHEKTLILNAYGAAKDEFTLSETGLLGHYQVEASFKYNKETVRTYASFQVDEYKRPDYQVELLPEAELQFDKESHVQGRAMYYFGAPLDKATVKYTVKRSAYYPPFWWWRTRLGSEEKLLTEGETTTGKDGSFKISFTPQDAADPFVPSQFTVHAQVFDASGRVIEASRTYKVSRKPLFFQASFDKGFYEANTASSLAEIALTDVNGAPEEGKFTAEIIELENKLIEKNFQSEEDEDLKEPVIYAKTNSPALENLFGENKELRRVSAQTFTVKKEDKVHLQLPALPEGIYKLKLQTKKADTAELIFLVADKNSKLALPAVAIVQHNTYYPGSQAKLLIGAGALTGAKYIEVYQAGQFLAAKDLLAPGVSIYSLPISNDWRGGITVRWFGASHYELYQDSAYIQVPYDNKELTLTLNTPESVKPGEKINWTLTAKDATGAGVQGLASVRVYDKSLDYYVKTKPVFSLDNLYPRFSDNTRTADSQLHVYSSYYSTMREKSACELAGGCINAPEMPRLNLQMYFRSYGDGLLLNTAMVKSAAPMAMKSRAVNDFAEMAVSNDADMAIEETESVQTAGTAESGAAEQTIRTDFSETAYFNPMLAIQGGKAAVQFTMPQSLTAWNIMAFALTKNADFGALTAQTVTRKDLSVRLSLPRFWREGDQSTLVAQVTNLSNKKRTAEVTLDILLDGKNAAGRLGVSKLTQSVTVEAARTAAATWPVSIPQGVGILDITATVRAGADIDAEHRQLPLLPAKERIAESVTAALDSGSQTLKLENLLTEDPTREVSAVTLRLDPGLLLSVFNAMPQLLKARYNDALSVADRYVPLAVVNAFYKKYPMLQSAMAQLPKRQTQAPAWNNNQDPARLMLLEETPWLQTSRGGAGQEKFLTDLFNPAAVQTARDKAEKNLKKYQTPSGGYSWMSGGEPSEFITLRLLASYAEILRYGGQIPQAEAQKALSWLAPRIEKDLKDSQPSVYGVSHALYAAYVFTAFPQNWSVIKKAPVKKWLDYADAHSAYMTALGQTYAAAAYHRIGENTKAQNYLDLVLSRMKTDPVTGSYFAPEAQSWLWYNDTLSTQTTTLRTLLELRPESDKAQGLVKWLLFNRKAQAWRSTAATAEAVYALLDYMQHRGLLDDPAEYHIQWGAETKTLHFEPFDWSEQLAWTQEAKNVSPSYYTAQATKRGGLTGFITLDAVYTTANAAASPKGVLNVSRRYLLKYTEDGREKVREIQPGETVPVGSEVEVQLTLDTSSAFDFVVLSDPKPAGFETTELLSGWSWDVLSVYKEYENAATNFFINRVPAGTYTLRYTLRPTLGGIYHALPAQVQSMYAPEFSAHTVAGELAVH